MVRPLISARPSTAFLAESVAVALTERFQVPAENLTTQGYGEQYLKVQTQAAEVQNRRVTVRRITPLITVLAAN